MEKDRSINVVTVASAVLLTVLVGWLIVIGQALLLPIVIGVILVYILTTVAEALGRIPVAGGLPRGIRLLLVGLIALGAAVYLVSLTMYNAGEIVNSLPEYTKNLQQLFDRASASFGFETAPSVSNMIEEIQDAIDLNKLAATVVSGLSGAGTFLVTALLYAMFLLSEWNDFPAKMRRAFHDEAHADTAMNTLHQISERIGGYLTTKTLINVILGVASYIIMLLIGVEYAAFWAIWIGLLNYIPYIGSVLGVLFPVALTFAQFGTLGHPAAAFVLLMAAQLVVGNVLEPRMLGRSVNMSPFVVLAALAFWMEVWGVIGAILAIPMTSMVMIILAEIPGTRPIAALMSEDGNV
ncbi:MAG: AI-2E family transporter [Rhodobacterales bacterium]|nr:MAG: AI-2E family transporter [Rhodobacterales bacterium]